MKAMIRLSGLVALAAILHACGTTDREDYENYDAGLAKTEAYRDGRAPDATHPYGAGPWTTDPQYDYYESYNTVLDRLIWRDQNRFR